MVDPITIGLIVPNIDGCVSIFQPLKMAVSAFFKIQAFEMADPITMKLLSFLKSSESLFDSSIQKNKKNEFEVRHSRTLRTVLVQRG